MAPEPSETQSGSDESDDSNNEGDEWALKKPEQVLSQRKIGFPRKAKHAICEDIESDTQTVIFWNYDPETNYPFIARRPPEKEEYAFGGRNVVESPNKDHATIRPPSQSMLPDTIIERFETEGTHMIFLASEQMLEGSNPSVWIIPWSEIVYMLPEGASRDNLNRVLSSNPGFLPSDPFR